MIRIETSLTAADLQADVDRVWALSARKLLALHRAWDPKQGAPVFTTI